MKKIITLGLVLAAVSGFAQTAYDFSYKTGQPYTPLSTGTDIVAGLPWTAISHSIPLGFDAKIGGVSVTKFIIESDLFMPASGTVEPYNTFLPLGANLVDRGKPGKTHQSPIRYLTEGSKPDRIFKVEYWNAGFMNEYIDASTTNDSINFQVWVYETSDIVEFHYGSNSIKGTGNFLTGENPVIFYAELNAPSTGSYTRCYNLQGDPVTPSMDSSYGGGIRSVLEGVPSEGTVYRFTPRAAATAIGEKALQSKFSVYPSVSTGALYLDNTAAAAGTIAVFASTGQQVLQDQVLLPGINQLSVDRLPAALYLVRVNTSEGTASYRFVKK